METPKPEGLNITYYLSLVSRKRWLLIVPFCLALIVGSVLAVKLPKTYEATTLILVQPQRVPEKLVQPVVDANIENRISNLSQQILSRSNLEKVIERFKLFSSDQEKNMLSEDKIESLRKRITVEVSRTAHPQGRRIVFDRVPGRRPQADHAGHQRPWRPFSSTKT